jgi:hypothetical protein
VIAPPEALSRLGAEATAAGAETADGAPVPVPAGGPGATTGSVDAVMPAPGAALATGGGISGAAGVDTGGVATGGAGVTASATF